MAKMVTVYLRDDKAYVSPRAGYLAMNWGIEPVFVAETGVRPIAEALAQAIAAAPLEGDPKYRSWKDWPGDPILKASGIKSRSAFERGAKHFDIDIFDDRTVVTRTIPDPNHGSASIGDNWKVTLEPIASAEQIAKTILDAAPTTPTRPPLRREAIGKSAGDVSTADLPRLFETYIPEFMRQSEASLFQFEDERAAGFIGLLTEFIDDLPDDVSVPRSASNDQLKRVLALVELLLGQGDDGVRDAVLSQFIRTSIAATPLVWKLAGKRTRSALKAQRTVE